MTTHSMYCVGLKRKVDATVVNVVEISTKRGVRYQVKGQYTDESGKQHNCTSMIGKALAESMGGSISTPTPVADATEETVLNLSAEEVELRAEDVAVVETPDQFPDGSGHIIGSQTLQTNYTPLHAEGDGVETPAEVTEIEVVADEEEPQVDNAYTDESGIEPAEIGDAGTASTEVAEPEPATATIDALSGDVAPESTTPDEYEPYDDPSAYDPTTGPSFEGEDDAEYDPEDYDPLVEDFEDYDPVAASFDAEWGETFGWNAEDADSGAFSDEFLAHSNETHDFDPEDYDPLVQDFEGYDPATEGFSAEPRLGSGGRFRNLEHEIAEEYEEKGDSDEEAERIGAATAAKIGIDKYGRKRFDEMARAGRRRASRERKGAEPGYVGNMTLDDYEGIDSVMVDRTAYQPSQDYGADTFEAVSMPQSSPMGGVPVDYGGNPVVDDEIGLEAENVEGWFKQNTTLVAGTALVLGMVLAYTQSDKINTLFDSLKNLGN